VLIEIKSSIYLSIDDDDDDDDDDDGDRSTTKYMLVVYNIMVIDEVFL